VGRLKSASTASTFAPFCASATARFASVVVLPSAGFALVTSITRPVVSAEEKIRFVRSTR
jgi:hypothetical protein